MSLELLWIAMLAYGWKASVLCDRSSDFAMQRFNASLMVVAKRSALRWAIAYEIASLLHIAVAAYGAFRLLRTLEG